MKYTIYSGSLVGPESRETSDPIEALLAGRTFGPGAFVVQTDTAGQRSTVWSPASDKRHVGPLNEAYIQKMGAL